MSNYFTRLQVDHYSETTGNEELIDGNTFGGAKSGKWFRRMSYRQYAFKTIDGEHYRISKEQYDEIRDKMINNNFGGVFIMRFDNSDHDEQIIPIRCIITIGVGTGLTHEELPKAGYEEGSEKA